MTNDETEVSMDDAGENESNQDTLGSLLKAGREARGLTIEEAAKLLHLRPQIVRDLEQDNFSNIASSTYVRGYVKNYARLLVIDPLLIHQCLALQVPQVTEPEMQSFSRKTTRQARDSRWMWVTYFIVFVLLAMLVLWWVQKSNLLTTTDFSKPTVEEVAASTQGQREDVAFESGELRSLDAPLFEETDPAAAVIEDVIDTDVPKTAAETLQADADLQAKASGAQQIDTQTTPSTSDVNLSNDVSAAKPASEASVVTAPQTVVNSGSSDIAISLTGDCWINIIDATGKVLVDGVKGTGRDVLASGTPPFKVIFGAPQVVTLKLNGENVSLAEFPRGRVARFTLPLSQ